MPEMKLSQTQKLSQSQVMKLSQQQLMAMNLIAMGNMDLRDEILKKVDENPALELVENIQTSTVHTGSVTKLGKEAAEKYQKMMESAPDERETLKLHLIHQLNMIQLPENEHRICKKIIENLDEKGYFILAPVTLLEKNDSQSLLDRCIDIVQHFDPAGICCENVMESLEIQGRLAENPPKAALFLLHGRLDMLKPPVTEKVQKKILDYLREKEKMTFWTEKKNDILLSKEDVSEDSVEEAIKFIQSLDPYPARNFGTGGAQYITPDVYIVEDPKTKELKVVMAESGVPVVQVAQDVRETAEESGSRELILKLKDADSFVETLEFRKLVLRNAFIKLLEIQKDFFVKGPGNLVPLTQRKFADEIEVHESTVSRIAGSKFLRCSWGTFPVKYFFSASTTQTSGDGQEKEISTDAVKIEIEKILKAQKPGDKKLSDQKISDMLSEKGFKVARRTVSKYRSQLNIASSYER